MDEAKDGTTVRRVPLRENLLGQGLILTALALVALGVVMVYSTAAGRGRVSHWYYRRELRQLLFAAAAVVVLLTLWRFDYRWFIGRARLWCVLLALAVVSSTLVLVKGHAVGNRLRWLRWGPVGFQPSELLKFAVLVALAAFLSRRRERLRDFRRTFLPAMALVALACGLVVTQDFGTAVIIGLAAGVVMLVAGVPWYHFWLPLVLGGIGFYAFVYRDEHRWDRMRAMVVPVTSNLPEAYQPNQALISIACGAEPAGLGGGVAKYGYLPEDSTDFIFSIICEEMGAAGMAGLVGLLLLWLFLVRLAVMRATDRFGALLAGGLGFLIALQAAMHIAVNVKWLPPTGIALPFVSAGGTSLLVASAATAMVVSVTACRREEIEPPEAATPGLAGSR